MKSRAWIELDMDALTHNSYQLRKLLPEGCQLMAVVKAEAYGHGGATVAAHLEQQGIQAFAVATIDEGITLRHAGIRGQILVLGYTAPGRTDQLHQYDLIQTLIGMDYAQALDRQGIPIKGHIKVDTGMHRLGFDHSAQDQIAACFSLPNIRVCGIYSHLCAADSQAAGDVSFTKLQIHRFYRLLDQLSAAGISIPKVHLQSSYGLLNYPELRCDYVRAGIALYGVKSSPNEQTGLVPLLRPVLSLRSRIVQIRTVSVGETVGYGRCFTACGKRRIAVVPIGYADGIPRSLSCGKGKVLVCGCRVPVVGRVCMDQMMVDITGLPQAAEGTLVTLIGKDGRQEITAEELSAAAGTISNELLSRLGSRLPRVYAPDHFPVF